MVANSAYTYPWAKLIYIQAAYPDDIKKSSEVSYKLAKGNIKERTWQPKRDPFKGSYMHEVCPVPFF